MPGIINQLGPDNLANLKQIAESYQGDGKADAVDAEGDDGDVPDLDGTDFEEVSDDKQATIHSFIY